MRDMNRPSSIEPLMDAQEERVPPYESLHSAAGNGGLGPKPMSQDYMYNGGRPANVNYRPKNVILFGETGVGKSSVINLLAGEEVAETSSGLEGCTLEAKEYSFTFPGPIPFRIFDTVGLEEPELGVNTFLGAITKAHQLVKSLHSTGGVDLLLFCIRGGRITAAMQRNYKLFFDVLCESRVPLGIVVTNLEQEAVMEDWWIRNQVSFQRYGIRSVAHACITALPERAQMYAQQRAESQKALRVMLLELLSNANMSYMQEQRSWFMAIVQRLKEFLTKNSTFFKKKELLRKLETECKLPRSDAQVLAQMFTT